MYQRRRPAASAKPRAPRSAPPRALDADERTKILALLDSEDYVDKAPAEIVAVLLSKGEYMCSERTMYRILAAAGQLRARRQALRRPFYAAPELLATAPNQVWSWDVTWLRGPVPGIYFFLYVILDIFSRYIVGWTLAQVESSEVAERLITATYEKEGIEPGQVIIHADRGPVPRSQTLSDLYDRLGVQSSFSRPRVSNDNPYSESYFKTHKYSAGYPDRFSDYDDALGHCRRFMPDYNHNHHHSGIAMLTPSDVHHGRVDEILVTRQQALDAAYAAHPERFVSGPPIVKRLPSAVYINPPKEMKDSSSCSQNS